ncbi:MAG: polysaccharide biosynthesis/export family protein [Bacteroidetes bacterium]|nr:polysaccharide biosynthesis/export family protein [Bacteroidota bacterium]
MKFYTTVALLILTLFTFSCKVQKAIPTYLDNYKDSAGTDIVKMPELKIQKGDFLSVQIYSLSLDPKAYEIFNLPCASASTAAAGATTCGFLVDDEGNIIHPRLGAIHAAGLTKQELAASVKNMLVSPKELLTNPTVLVNYLNYKITVLGEVRSPGTLSIPETKVTILQALGMSGDITEYGKKSEVKILREYNGKREIGVIDLTSSKMFESPFYNLNQNDVVMVDAVKQKKDKTSQDLIIARTGFVMSVITSAILLYNTFRR